IHRCDETRVQPVDDRVGDLVARVLEVLYPLGLRLDVLVVLDEVLQEPGGGVKVATGRDEEVEELNGALSDLELRGRGKSPELSLGGIGGMPHVAEACPRGQPDARGSR